jgi:hypothetical protein
MWDSRRSAGNPTDPINHLERAGISCSLEFLAPRGLRGTAVEQLRQPISVLRSPGKGLLLSITRRKLHPA